MRAQMPQHCVSCPPSYPHLSSLCVVSARPCSGCLSIQGPLSLSFQASSLLLDNSNPASALFLFFFDFLLFFSCLCDLMPGKKTPGCATVRAIAAMQTILEIHVSKIAFSQVVFDATYIPSRTKNSFSFCINGFPQPPTISGIR